MPSVSPVTADVYLQQPHSSSDRRLAGIHSPHLDNCLSAATRQNQRTTDFQYVDYATTDWKSVLHLSIQGPTQRNLSATFPPRSKQNQCTADFQSVDYATTDWKFVLHLSIQDRTKLESYLPAANKAEPTYDQLPVRRLCHT